MEISEESRKLADIPATDPADSETLPTEQGELEKLAANLKSQMETRDADIQTLDNQIEDADTGVATAGIGKPLTRNFWPPVKPRRIAADRSSHICAPRSRLLNA